MRIVILGAGQVGGTLAYNLVHEDNDITLVDINGERLRDLQHRLDIKTVQGSASHPNVLIEAGIEQADMLIAVTDSDEINMMGCQIAYSLFRTPNKIARIRSHQYYQYPEIFHNDHIPVDACISPEQLVTEHIVNLIEYPGASQVIDFSEGRVLLVTIKTQAESMMVGKTIGELDQYLSAIEAGVVGIFRNNAAIPIETDCMIMKGDDVLFVASPQAIQQTLIAFGRYIHPNRRIIIAGGGHIGTKLAQTLETRYRIKIIEHNAERANFLASHLHKSTILQGDIADRDLLVNENIEFTDVFCAVTNDDEANIMSCLQAKRLGTRHAMALVNRNAYVDLIDDSTIDHAISPQLITIGSILTKLRRGNMIKVHRLHDEAEAIELVVHGDKQTSQVIGRRLDEIALPPTCILAAIVREEKVYIASKELVLETGDHVILLLLKKRYVRHVEALFQVNLSFVS
ncbi:MULTISPECIES: Trk system potassium transporter TrkA [Legionella]|uniref:Trk system potassium uptake protein TrkA n=1 Tax=Legionella septentrionalis TaxID=2498109 RepID=A0A3S0X3Z3_9GAMM|nr:MULTISPECIES: Trk system potassium transporter TrkA [Legionella]MCP0913847.1 Trk system potassium transporter TrkA [Legionella sp. 27cVA30]RUQ85282.1 Trk system potassium transporter TrkA [Legionella septentrionalis]RUQ98694.1 Trk system potassium transporter TrkA [Legionella septentrionalis]RUR09934.1 Trk system potassium transporter TrkA [Legionella septentrionalis]RUR14987.1 Trk system potassium transporter TrkA [Legionella septentrionalis]